MRSANQDQTAGSILLGEYLGISSARVLRKLSVVKSFPRDRRIENASRTKAWRRIRLHLGTRIARTGLRSIRKRARRTQCRREWSSGLRRNPTLGQKNARGKAAREARWRSGRAARRQRRCRGARLP